jgi:hypothetical protein
MMAVEVEIDVELLKSEIKKTYASVTWTMGRLAPGERVLDLSGARTDSLIVSGPTPRRRPARCRPSELRTRSG